VAEDSGLADALSTAIFAMDLESGRALIDSLVGVEAMWITPSLEIYHTDGFPLSE
jgi:thiamine biosynthesis lipoprotein